MQLGPLGGVSSFGSVIASVSLNTESPAGRVSVFSSATAGVYGAWVGIATTVLKARWISIDCEVPGDSNSGSYWELGIGSAGSQVPIIANSYAGKFSGFYTQFFILEIPGNSQMWFRARDEVLSAQNYVFSYTIGD